MIAGLGAIRGLPFDTQVMVMDMKPKQRAKAIAEQLDKSDKHKWPALIEAAIRDTENDIIARLSETLESQSDPMSPSSAAAIVRELYRFKAGKSR
jgi:hypothetical protein